MPSASNRGDCCARKGWVSSDRRGCSGESRRVLVRLLAVNVDMTIGDGEFLVLSPTEDGLTVGFQRVLETKEGNNRLHLDLVVDDVDEATAEVEKLGGRWLEPGKTRELEGSNGAAWRTRGGRLHPAGQHPGPIGSHHYHLSPMPVTIIFRHPSVRLSRTAPPSAPQIRG